MAKQLAPDLAGRNQITRPIERRDRYAKKSQELRPWIHPCLDY